MKILSLCGNYNSLKDGIGRYTKILNDELKNNEEIEKIFIATEYTDDLKKVNLLYSMKMSKAILKAIKILKEEKIDILIVEYPFIEHNPIILLFFIYLKRMCQNRDISLILSLHEYLRSRKLRQILIEILVRNSDKIIVSDKLTKNCLLKYNSNIFIRDIPCIIDTPKIIKKNYNKKFIYFGLVNNSKAFYPMISAWKEFNRDKKYEFNVITSSEINIKDCNEYNIQILKNLNEDEIAIYMSEANFCILPILPNISYNNSTFKTASMFGCIPIGKFDKDFKCLDFIVDLISYEKEEFLKSFEKVINMSLEELKKKFDESRNFGIKFSIQNAALRTVQIMKNKSGL